MEAMEAENKILRAEVAKHAPRKTIVEQLSEAREETDKLRADLRIAQFELALARRALRNPAFADAAIVGSARPAPAGMPPSDNAPMTKEQAIATYNRIDGAQARADFRKANWRILGIEEEK